mgnify:CR=1 FL=1
MILTTTNSIEGHKIQDYLGIVTGVSYMLKKSFSFKAEKNKNLFEGLMNKSKEDAFQNLKANAIKLKANAVVGIKIDMETESGAYFFISITGTAVKVI